MSTSRFQRIFIIAGIISLFIAYIGLWIRFINDPVERTGSDFIAFYSAGRVAQEYGFSRVYEPDLQQDVQEKEVGFPLVEGQVLLHNHPPLLLPILRLLMNEDYVVSFHRWVFLLIAIYVAALTILSRLLLHAGQEQRTVWGLAVGSFLFLPLFFSLMNGQDTAIVFLGTAIWLYGLSTGRHWMAGLGLSLTVLRPQLSLAFAIPMLFSRRKAFLGYVIGSSILVALAVLIVGIDGTQKYIDILLISTGGEWHGMKEESMVNLLGLALRVFGMDTADVFRTWGWIIFAASIIALTALWARQKELQSNLIGLTVIVALFTSPHLHFHDLTLLLIPLYELVRSGYLKDFTAIAFPIAASLLLLISNITPVLQFTAPYLLMLTLAMYPYISKQRQALTTPHRS